MRVAYVNYRYQSGVPESMRAALKQVGADVVDLDCIGPVELRRGAEGPFGLPSARALVNLAVALPRFGLAAPVHRWNTPFAFDVHSRRAGDLLSKLEAPPDLVLQNGALFSPGLPPRLPYALLVDNTRMREMRSPGVPEAGLLPPPEYGRAWYERELATYRGARLVFSFSADAGKSLVQDYGVPRERVIVLGAGANAVPAHVVRRDERCRSLIFVGTRWNLKGGPILARAFARLRRRFPDAELHVVGPPKRPVYLPAGAHWHGFVPTHALTPLFQRASVFVLPTLREAFGLAYLDAMAHGLACIGTAVGAVPEIIGEGETGLVVPPRDADALERAMAELLADPERTRKMGRAGRARVLSHFNWPSVARRLLEAWSKETGLQEPESVAAASPGPERRRRSDETPRADV